MIARPARISETLLFRFRSSKDRDVWVVSQVAWVTDGTDNSPRRRDLDDARELSVVVVIVEFGQP